MALHWGDMSNIYTYYQYTTGMDEILSEVIEERERLEKIIIFMDKRLKKYTTIHDKILHFTTMDNLDKSWAFDEIVKDMKINE